MRSGNVAAECFSEAETPLAVIASSLARSVVAQPHRIITNAETTASGSDVLAVRESLPVRNKLFIFSSLAVVVDDEKDFTTAFGSVFDHSWIKLGP